MLSLRFGIECFGVASKSANWYPVVSMVKVAAAIAERNTKPLIGYGHSMGGYACIKYSWLLRLSGSISSSPQISIDPAETGRDTRYAEHFDASLHQGMRIRAEDIIGRTVIVFDPLFKADRIHAEAIRSIKPDIKFLSVRRMAHRGVVAMKPRSVLLPLFAALLNGSALTPIQQALDQERKRHPQYRLYLARAALLAGKPRLAKRILESINELADPKLGFWRDMFMVRALAQAADYAGALELAATLARRWPKSLEARKQLERLRQTVT